MNISDLTKMQQEPVSVEKESPENNKHGETTKIFAHQPTRSSD
jgi:hypothetical protein